MQVGHNYVFACTLVWGWTAPSVVRLDACVSVCRSVGHSSVVWLQSGSKLVGQMLVQSVGGLDGWSVNQTVGWSTGWSVIE